MATMKMPCAVGSGTGKIELDGNEFVPNMGTSTSTSDGQIMYSSAYNASVYPPYAPFNWLNGQVFTPAANDSNPYYGFRSTSTFVAKMLVFIQRNINNISAVEVRASNDGFSTYDVITSGGARTIDTLNRRCTVALLDNNTAYNEYRLYITTSNPSGTEIYYVQFLN